jgi:mono/diheme cytochrome c family protein
MAQQDEKAENWNRQRVAEIHCAHKIALLALKMQSALGTVFVHGSPAAENPALPTFRTKLVQDGCNGGATSTTHGFHDLPDQSGYFSRSPLTLYVNTATRLKLSSLTILDSSALVSLFSFLFMRVSASAACGWHQTFGEIKEMARNQAKSRSSAATILLCGLLGFTLIVGCEKTGSNSQAPAPAKASGAEAEAGESTGPFAVGKQVFAVNCSRCHSDGSTGGMMAGGPAMGRGMMGGPPMDRGPRAGGPPPAGETQEGGPKAGGPREDGPPLNGGPKAGGPGMRGGPGGGMRGGFSRGPSLAKVAADAKHTREWLREHILDPQSHTPESRMPKFAGKLSDRGLQDLLDYLGSLK